MIHIMNKITASVAPTYTYLKNFREEDYSKIDFSILSDLDIKDVMIFKGFEKDDSKIKVDTLSTFTSVKRYKFKWSLFNDEDEKWVDKSITVNFPTLYQGLYFYIQGSRYYLVLSIADTGNIHSKQKIILRR